MITAATFALCLSSVQFLYKSEQQLILPSLPPPSFPLSLSLTQVLRQKQVNSPQVKQASVRRFATFDLFNRRRLPSHDPTDTSGDQWVEYTSVYLPEFSALLRYTRTLEWTQTYFYFFYFLFFIKVGVCHFFAGMLVF